MSELFSVDRPAMLWIGAALVLLILLGVWRHTVRRRRLAEFLGGARAVDRLSRSDLYRARLERAVLLGVAAAAMSLAAADLGWTDAPADPPTPSPRNLVLALDVSASMQATDVSDARTRLGRATEVARAIVDSVPDARVGLLLFAGTSYALALPTLDHDAVHFLLDGVVPTIASALDPGTLLATGIEGSLALLDRADEPTEDPDRHEAGLLEDLPTPFGVSDDADGIRGGERHIVLIGDGDTAEPDGWIEDVAATARESGVRIHAIGVGTTTGGGMVMPSGTYQLGGRVVDQIGNDAISRLNESALERTALAGGGLYARGDDGVRIASLIDVLRRTPDAVESAPNDPRPQWLPNDLVFLLGMLALLLVTGEALLDVAPLGGGRRTSVSRPRIPGLPAPRARDRS